MALTQAYDNGLGVVFPNAVYRIGKITIDWAAQRAVISVWVYCDGTYLTQEKAFTGKEYEIGPADFTAHFGGIDSELKDASDIRLTCYGFLLTLPEFDKAGNYEIKT